jgi:uncharacterized membrane protein
MWRANAETKGNDVDDGTILEAVAEIVVEDATFMGVAPLRIASIAVVVVVVVTIEIVTTMAAERISGHEDAIDPLVGIGVVARKVVVVDIVEEMETAEAMEIVADLRVDMAGVDAEAAHALVPHVATDQEVLLLVDVTMTAIEVPV